MASREKIREGLEDKINRFDTFRDEYSYESFADEILKYLDSRGVAIRGDFTEEGYFAWFPLIKEE